MEAFRWSSNFVTGLTEVDEQHSRLVERINRFGNLAKRNGRNCVACMQY